MPTLPHEFADRMKSQLGNESDAFFASLDMPSPTSIRLHPLKGKSPYDLQERVPWCDLGYYLPERPSFHLDPHWHGGAYYVQEASSMILDYVLSQLTLHEDSRVLVDLCAAPGGKTGILAKHLRPCDILVANEVVNQRRAVLRENLIKAGYLNTFLSGEPASSFRDPFTDLLLIDAPCAGEGMMRKDPEAIRQWSPSLVQSCMVMQQQIVHQAIRCLKQDGILVYSTCSYSMQENVDNVLYFQEQYGLESVSISFPDAWGIQTLAHGSASGYQLYPHRVKGEGLFVAVMKRMAVEENPFYKTKRPPKLFEEVPEWLSAHLSKTTTLRVLRNHPGNMLIHKEAEMKAIEVLTHLRGAEIIAEAGELKGKDFIPSHFMAMAGMMAEGTEIIDVTYSQALDFLERATTSLPQGKPPGWYVIRYDHTHLGWVKWTLQGWKNHYPMNWRLRDRKPR